MEEQFITISFPNKIMTVREYLAFSKNILSELKAFSDDFKQLYAWGSEAHHGKFLKEDLRDFDPVVFEQIKDEKIAYVNPDKTNKDFTLDSKSFIGFSNSYSTDKDYKKEQITITISAGEYDSNLKKNALLNFEFSKTLQTKINYSKMMELLQFGIELVTPIYGRVISDEFRDKIEEAYGESDCEIGWINYFSDERVFSLLPEDIGKKKLSDGGCIFWLSEKKASSIDEQSIYKALEIREILSREGLCNIK